MDEAFALVERPWASIYWLKVVRKSRVSLFKNEHLTIFYQG